MRRGDAYRWVYDVNLWKDTILPVMFIRILLLAALAPALVLFAVTALEGEPGKGLLLFIQVYGMTACGLIALFIVVYPVFIVIKGGRYSILFEMDDHGIRHIEMPRTARRSEVMSWAGFAAGVLAKNPTLMGSSLLAGSKSQSYSAFQNVRKIIHHKRKGVMRLICRDMTRNLIYLHPADAEFVGKFITEHCKKDVQTLEK